MNTIETQCSCTTQFCKHRKAQVWSCGGGTQSCAIAALIVQGKLPKPDFSVIADTGYETGATWEYMDRVLVPELNKVGVELVRVKASEFATVGLWTGADKDTVAIPAYSTMDGVMSKLPNFCTGEWKTRVIHRWLSHQGVKHYVKWIGFSIDETVRVLRMQKTQTDVFFPLVEHRLNRRGCVKLVQEMGWVKPPRSRCWICPNQLDSEWRELPKSEFQEAVELEREIHKVDPDAWLHRSCIPLDQVDFSQPEDLFSRPCDSGMCFV